MTTTTITVDTHPRLTHEMRWVNSAAPANAVDVSMISTSSSTGPRPPARPDDIGLTPTTFPWGVLGEN